MTRSGQWQSLFEFQSWKRMIFVTQKDECITNQKICAYHSNSKSLEFGVVLQGWRDTGLLANQPSRIAKPLLFTSLQETTTPTISAKGLQCQTVYYSWSPWVWTTVKHVQLAKAEQRGDDFFHRRVALMISACPIQRLWFRSLIPPFKDSMDLFCYSLSNLRGVPWPCGGHPIAGWFSWKIPSTNGWWLGVPPFQRTSV